jgi:peptidoglycan/LPS O-acetylase OafA/YrhL
MRAEIPALTGFRFLAAALVFFYHSQWRGQFILFGYGWIGVPLFFALSGFLMAYMYKERFASLGGWEVGTFYWRRFVRIYPAYILVAACAAWLQNLRYGVHDWEMWTYNFALIHQFFGRYQTALCTPFWSLPIELTFYLLFPFLICLYEFAFRRLGLLGVAATLVLTTVVGFSSGYLLAPAQKDLGYLMIMVNWQYQTIFGHLFTFGSGIAAAYVFLSYERVLRGNLASVLVLATGVISFYGVMALLSSGRVSGLLRSLGMSTSWDDAANCFLFSVPGALVILGLCGANRVAAILSTKPLIMLGAASYVLYLIHHVGEYIWFMPLWGSLLFFVVCNAAAIGIHLYYERPIQYVLLAFWKRWIAPMREGAVVRHAG